MVVIHALLNCALILAQVGEPVIPPPPQPVRIAQRQQWLLDLRLKRAQEITYRGTFDERSFGGGIRFDRRYRFHNRLFVLSANQKHYDLAFLTTYRTWEKSDAASKDEQPEAHSIKLARVKVDRHGRMVKTAGGEDWPVPLEGPPTLELGAFTELPLTRVTPDRTWTQKIPGHPQRDWKVVGIEMVNGARCIKAIGTQQSPAWTSPRVPGTAWRRRDTVWIASETGLAYRVERVIEKRLPARKIPTYRSVLRFDLDQNLPYPPNAVDDYQQEILQTLRFEREALPLLTSATLDRRKLAGLGLRIDAYAKQQSTKNPYRSALLDIRRRVRAAEKGEIPAQLPKEVVTPPAFKKPKAVPGQPAPDFVVNGIAPAGPARLKDWSGQPLLLLFYHPHSSLFREMLPYLDRLQRKHPEMRVVAIAMTRDHEQVERHRKAARLKFPVIQGTALRASYDVEATPKIMVVDAKGVVRASLLGWGNETLYSLRDALKRWAPKRESTQSLYGPDK